LRRRSVRQVGKRDARATRSCGTIPRQRYPFLYTGLRAILLKHFACHTLGASWRMRARITSAGEDIGTSIMVGTRECCTSNNSSLFYHHLKYPLCFCSYAPEWCSSRPESFRLCHAAMSIADFRSGDAFSEFAYVWLRENNLCADRPTASWHIRSKVKLRRRHVLVLRLFHLGYPQAPVRSSITYRNILNTYLADERARRESMLDNLLLFS
jgi:hypothetical protein